MSQLSASSVLVLFLTGIIGNHMLVSQACGLPFYEDFEDGNFDGWTVGGRQEGRASIADVVSRGGSLMGHVYQDGFTGISLTRGFDYRPDLAFEFDMDTSVYSEASSTSSYFAIAQALFIFFNASGEELGYVRYSNFTSSYYPDSVNPNPHRAVVPVNSGLASYSVNIQDLLSLIEIDMDGISLVGFGILSYCSGNSYNMRAHTWLDNVVVTPEPSTVLLITVTALHALRRRPRGA